MFLITRLIPIWQVVSTQSSALLWHYFVPFYILYRISKLFGFPINTNSAIFREEIRSFLPSFQRSYDFKFTVLSNNSASNRFPEAGIGNNSPITTSVLFLHSLLAQIQQSGNLVQDDWILTLSSTMMEHMLYFKLLSLVPPYSTPSRKYNSSWAARIAPSTTESIQITFHFYYYNTFAKIKTSLQCFTICHYQYFLYFLIQSQ